MKHSRIYSVILSAGLFIMLLYHFPLFAIILILSGVFLAIAAIIVYISESHNIPEIEDKDMEL